MAEVGESVAALVWSLEPAVGGPVPAAIDDIPSAIPEVATLARALRGRGFRFLGPTTVYAAMQALGVVNDDVATCFARAEREKTRSALVRPGR
jgi:DNA-3-methyladenine glycosylase I